MALRRHSRSQVALLFVLANTVVLLAQPARVPEVDEVNSDSAGTDEADDGLETSLHSTVPHVPLLTGSPTELSPSLAPLPSPSASMVATKPDDVVEPDWPLLSWLIRALLEFDPTWLALVAVVAIAVTAALSLVVASTECCVHHCRYDVLRHWLGHRARSTPERQPFIKVAMGNGQASGEHAADRFYDVESGMGASGRISKFSWQWTSVAGRRLLVRGPPRDALANLDASLRSSTTNFGRPSYGTAPPLCSSRGWPCMPYESLQLGALCAWWGIVGAVLPIALLPPLVFWQHVREHTGTSPSHDLMVLVAMTSTPIASLAHRLIFRVCERLSTACGCVDAEFEDVAITMAADSFEAGRTDKAAEWEAAYSTASAKATNTTSRTATEATADPTIPIPPWPLRAIGRFVRRCACAWPLFRSEQQRRWEAAEAARRLKMQRAVRSMLQRAVRRAWNQLALHGRLGRLKRLAAERAARLAERQRDKYEGMSQTERRFRVAREAAAEHLRDDAVQQELAAAVRRDAIEEALMDAEGGAEISDGELPPRLLLGLTLDALRAQVDAVPPDAVTAFHKSGGQVQPAFGAGVPGATSGAFGYGNPNTRAVSGYVYRHIAEKRARCGGSAGGSAGGSPGGSTGGGRGGRGGSSRGNGPSSSCCEKLLLEGSTAVGPADVYVSCPRRVPLPRMLEVLEEYLRSRAELDFHATRFWVFDFSTRPTDEGAAEAFYVLDRIVASVGRTAVVLEPWRDPSALHRTLCLMEVIHAHRARTYVAGDELPGQPRGAAGLLSWEEAPGGAYGTDREAAGGLEVRGKLELALGRVERASFEKALHGDYAKLMDLLGLIAHVDLKTSECRSRVAMPNAQNGLRTRVLQKLQDDEDGVLSKLVLWSEVSSSSEIPSSPPAAAGADVGEEGVPSPGALSVSALGSDADGDAPISPSVLHKLMANDRVRLASVQARKVLRGAILDEARRLLARTRVEDRRHTHIVTHLSLLEQQIRLANLRDDLGSGHEETLDAATSLAAFLRSLHAMPGAERFRADAVQLLRDVVRERKRTAGDSAPATLAAINQLGLALQASGKQSEAEALVAKVQKERAKTLGADHPSTLAARSKLGAMLASRGEHDRAEAALRSALDGRRQTHGVQSEATIRSILSLANVLNAQDKVCDRRREHTRARADVVLMSSTPTRATTT